jgi:hypothetical protein
MSTNRLFYLALLSATLLAAACGSGNPSGSKQSGGANPPPPDDFSGVLSAPLNLRAEPGNAQVLLRWNSVVGASGYQVCWAAEPGLTDISALVCQDIQSNQYLHKGVDGGGGFIYYRVAATRGQDAGPFSEELGSRPALAVSRLSDQAP